jgi:hypothetical protein
MSVPRKRHQLTARRAGSAGIINRTALGGRPARLRAGRRGCEPHCAVASIVASAPGATGGEGPVAAVTGSGNGIDAVVRDLLFDDNPFDQTTSQRLAQGLEASMHARSRDLSQALLTALRDGVP